ncbi:hypothetical protein GXB74_02860 [Klebsiella pneumoniae]|nr:hypothetical protein [Klebsiella pneumoniae]HBW8057567.1 hypothetical protein [Klebsiella pneumoniae]
MIEEWQLCYRNAVFKVNAAQDSRVSKELRFQKMNFCWFHEFSSEQGGQSHPLLLNQAAAAVT